MVTITAPEPSRANQASSPVRDRLCLTPFPLSLLCAPPARQSAPWSHAEQTKVQNHNAGWFLPLGLRDIGNIGQRPPPRCPAEQPGCSMGGRRGEEAVRWAKTRVAKSAAGATEHLSSTRGDGCLLPRSRPAGPFGGQLPGSRGPPSAHAVVLVFGSLCAVAFSTNERAALCLESEPGLPSGRPPGSCFLKPSAPSRAVVAHEARRQARYSNHDCLRLVVGNRCSEAEHVVTLFRNLVFALRSPARPDESMMPRETPQSRRISSPILSPNPYH